MQPTQSPAPRDTMNQMPDVDVAGAGAGASAGQWPAGDGLGSVLYSHKAPFDPRTSSTQSLVSSMDTGELGGRRTLLVVYIHGFMGNNSSFRSFPAHVHSFLKELLAETHVIHTKIYPRYKTYKSIEVACENFSNWLAPHESRSTDVVLVGHSMGGLLAAEVVLLPARTPYNTSSPFRHRILATVSLDAPLLGLHPGIVVSGITSLFRPAPSPPALADDAPAEAFSSRPQDNLSPDPAIHSEDSAQQDGVSPSLTQYPSGSVVSSSGPEVPDPYFNPHFFNDVSFVDRGWVKNMVHFVSKHQEENIVHAAANHIVSHLEFGGCMADYPGLKSRYKRLRMLEDVDEWHQTESGARLERVRFVNYYTVSTGVIKKPEPESPQSLHHSDGSRRSSLQELEPMPEPLDSPTTMQLTEPSTDENPLNNDPTNLGHDPQLDPIPPLPAAPTPPDLDALPDKAARKQAEKDFKQAVKAHSTAVKAREKAIKNQQKTLENQQKALEKQQRKTAKDEAKRAKQLEKEEQQLHKQQLKEQERQEKQQREAKEEEEKRRREREKKPKLRKFCMLPSKDSGGARDPAWVEVYMEGVDEVGAHCGLFFAGPHYERLVGDVGERIAGWVREDVSRRVILEGQLD
ncbi:hypothetical protein BT67DRAFT_460128 [Trichocladium antarcticum]|uniref:DUF676 domain-containing protein n=1 Tax=Trichocladium antarcticum TaxID=1450529 RepID=A0AAN6URW1_9PEZI|nr:hypothetical protein BT67DRAFT_460128 [Trichocladium antarcticum]